MDSVSATADKYYWLKYAVDRKTNVNTKQGTVTLSKGDLYGVRELRGKDLDEVVDAKTGIIFNLAISKSESLMNRGRPFRGKVVIAKHAIAKPKPATKQVSKPAERKLDAKPTIDKAMAQLLRKHGLTLDSLTTAKVRAAIEKMCASGDGASATQFKHWCVANVKSKVAKAAISKLAVCAQPVGQDRQQHVKKLKVKLSEVEMPEVDDFVDDEIPQEYLRYNDLSESASKGEGK